MYSSSSHRLSLPTKELVVDSGSMSPTYGIGLSAPSLTKPPHVMPALGFITFGLSVSILDCLCQLYDSARRLG